MSKQMAKTSKLYQGVYGLFPDVPQSDEAHLHAVCCIKKKKKKKKVLCMEACLFACSAATGNATIVSPSLLCDAENNQCTKSSSFLLNSILYCQYNWRWLLQTFHSKIPHQLVEACSKSPALDSAGKKMAFLTILNNVCIMLIAQTVRLLTTTLWQSGDQHK